MSKLETPMIRKYWHQVEGTLIEEFLAVRQTPTNGRRFLDAVILPRGEKRIAHWEDVSLEGEDVIVVQAKASRLGMYLMGQAVFSAELIRRFHPASVRSVALCTAGDSVLEPLLARFPEVEVVVMRASEETGSKEPEAITRALLDYGERIDPAALFPALVPEAQALAVSDAYAFTIATCLDRGTSSDIIWTIPFDIVNDLGHLNPVRVHQMSSDEMAALFARLPRKPRYVNAAPRTLLELTTIVVEQCDGDASRMWRGKAASEVKRTFLSIYGVGPGIANMAVLLIERAFPVRFDDLDRPNMDIKADVHTVRVLYRLGTSEDTTEKAAIMAARLLSPDFPGAVDAPLWMIGRQWCHAVEPECGLCPVEHVCAKRLP